MDNMVCVTGRKFACLSFVVVLILGIPSCPTHARKLATFGEEVLSNLGHSTNGEWIDIISKYKRVLNFQIEPSFLAAHFSVNTASSPRTETNFDSLLSSDTPIDMLECGISSPPLAMMSRLSTWTGKYFRTLLSSEPSATTTATPPHLEISTHNSVAAAGTFLPKSRSEDFGMFPSGPSIGAPHNELEPPFAPIEGQGEYENEPSPNLQTTQSPGT